MWIARMDYQGRVLVVSLPIPLRPRKVLTTPESAILPVIEGFSMAVLTWPGVWVLDPEVLLWMEAIIKRTCVYAHHLKR